MNAEKSWSTMVLVVGLLNIALAPTAATGGQSVSMPLLIGGIILSIIGFILVRKEGKR